MRRLTSVKIEAAVAALTVTAMETFALVVAVARADSNGDGGQNRVPTKVSCNMKRVVVTAARAMARRVAGEQRRRRQHGRW